MPGPAFRPHDEHLDEGDILADVPFGRWEEGKLVQGTPGRGIITSHGCACEDYERAIARQLPSGSERVRDDPR
jgi:hypothetical protein